MQNSYNCIIVHFGELVLKGKNRRFFIKQLQKNISRALKDAQLDTIHVISVYGYFLIEAKNENDQIIDFDKVSEILSKIPGIANFFPALKVKSDYDVICESIICMAQDLDFTSFYVRTKRSDKNFPKTSLQIDKNIGALIVEQKENIHVDFENPDVVFNIKIDTKNTYIYAKKINGIGGLPVGSAGKMVSLLSGGIDSPVASYLMAKRGVKSILCHFLPQTVNKKQVEEKIIGLSKRISHFQGKTVLYLIDFSIIQQHLVAHIPSSYRMIVYRRMMMRIAQRLSYMNRAKGIITGDCVAQVASQTLENLNTIYQATDIFVASPLIGYNKQEIMDIAVNIGTYDISVLPYDDCCTMIATDNPETHSKIETVLEYEEKLDIEAIITETFEKAVRIIICNQDSHHEYKA